MAVSAKKWGRRGTPEQDHTPKRDLYFHHTVGPGAFRNRADERREMRAIEDQHIRQGWLTIGYSGVLFPSGRLYWGRGPTALPAAQAGANSGTIAIALPGNMDFLKLTRRQKLRMITIAINFRVRRGIRRVGGHRDAPGHSTACPGKNIIAYLPTVAKRARLTSI